MNKDDLKQKLSDLQQDFELKRKKAIKEYCDANNPYKIGDKFTDHMGTILIKKISYYYSDTHPQCVYYGVELKKDGTPKKNNSIRDAWQTNEIK